MSPYRALRSVHGRPYLLIQVLFPFIVACLLLGAAASFADAAQKEDAGRSISPPPPDVPSARTGAGLSGAIIWEGTRGTRSLEPARFPASIRLADHQFNSRAGEPSLPLDLRYEEPPVGDERGRFIVQFDGVIRSEDRALIEAEGGDIHSYVPDYAYLVSISGRGVARLSESSRVVWSGFYHPAYKISTSPLMGEPGRREIVILLFPDGSIDEVSLAIAGVGGRLTYRSDNGINKILKVEIDTARINDVARLNDVAWIEPYRMPQLHNDEAQWVVQTNTLDQRRVWDMGITGEGQIISVSDTGLRTTHNQFFDASLDLDDFGDYPSHRKVIAYKRTIPGFANILFGDESFNAWHGTHTSGTSVGDDEPHGSSLRDGIAKHAKIYFLDGGGFPGPGVYAPPDLNDLLILPYDGNAAGGARIMTNSWGTPNGGAYDLHSMTADQFMWNHPDFLAFFSNGNDYNVNTVGSPATAKNVVSAGGTANGEFSDFYYPPTSAGPTDDGRFKPTICAPAQLYSASGLNDTDYQQLAGTSMACPAMASATVLVRQYLMEGWYPTGTQVAGNAISNPSAALMKAIAVNSADPDISNFVIPDNNVGWGRIDIDNVLYFAGDSRRLALVDNSSGLLTGDFVEYQVYVASPLTPLRATLVWTDYPGNPNAGVQLVNDLNLTASDGINSYKGNVYSDGHSVSGGDDDVLNVEENVRLDLPTAGIWTFRVEATNVPFGPQPFALVVTGGLASDQGLVVLDKSSYGGNDEVTIRVIDTNAGASVTVTAGSDTEPSTETVVLSGADGIYEGSLPLVTTYPISENGELSVSHGDQIVVTYEDASPVATLEATAMIDISGPVLTNVHAVAINEFDATIAWATSTAASSKVFYGTTPALGEESSTSTGLFEAHAVILEDLLPDQTYYYDVESVDHQGNAVRDDGGGAHYTFSTDRNRDVLLVIGDVSFDKTHRYLNAFERTGWSYTLWDGPVVASPFVGDRSVGMASYKAVVWQTGLEQYPMLTDAARDSISRLNSLGSRFAIFSHDVSWDFCAVSSTDYTEERCQWYEDELKAIWQADPLNWTQASGYAGDPISGDYVGGIPYTPHREGAAGDEIDGIAGNGSFANVWQSNAGPDDVAIRWTGNDPVGNPSTSVWGGTPNKVSSNFFEWAHLNNGDDDDPVRADVLDKTLIWLIGRDHPSIELVGPLGGEEFTGNSVSISWTESTDAGYGVAARKVYFSPNSGDEWVLLTDAAGPSPYAWDVSAVPNGSQYRVRVVLADDGAPVLTGADASGSDFTINRAGGDTRGPTVVAGSIQVAPNPIRVPDPVALTASVTDVYTGNSNIALVEWSQGESAASPGDGTAMTGTFDSPTEIATATIDSQLLDSGSATLWVRGQDAAGQWGNATSLTVVVNAVTATGETTIPGRFALYDCQPNPFNPVTTIRFALPKPANLRLNIYDVTGRQVRTLVDGIRPAGVGTVVWDGRDDAGHRVGSGIYLYRLDAEEFSDTKKMTLLK